MHLIYTFVISEKDYIKYLKILLTIHEMFIPDHYYQVLEIQEWKKLYQTVSITKINQSSYFIHFYIPYVYKKKEIYFLYCSYNDSQRYQLKCMQLTIFTRYQKFSNGKSYIRLSQSQKYAKLPISYILYSIHVYHLGNIFFILLI